MRPTVGQPIVATGTPFGLFCPEVFFNCKTSGSVCKTLGRNGEVFVTDVGLPCGTEGFLIVRKSDSSLNNDVVLEAVGMVIASMCMY